MNNGQFKADGFTQDLRLAQVNIDSLRMARAGVRLDEVRDISKIPETVAIEPFPGIHDPGHNPHLDLMKIRALYPYIKIMSLPARAVSVVLAANVAQDIIVPEGSIIARFASSGLFYMSQRGNAEVPVAGNSNPTANVGENFAHSYYPPTDTWFYVGRVNALSVISPNANTVVQLMLWKPE